MHVHITICTGTATISPPGIAPVCSGDQLELTCTTTGMFLNWSISLATPEDGATGQTYWRLLQSIGPIHQQAHQITVDSTTFHFSRSSAQDSLPVVSRLLISSTRNGTVINCTDVVSSDTTSTTVNIVNIGDLVLIMVSSIIYNPQTTLIVIHVQTIKWLSELCLRTWRMMVSELLWNGLKRTTLFIHTMSVSQ